ncbi:hypothetical protein H2509_13410 [Stappia sp. F7233]|uniref:Uncharacterized protein n=1 Tax=Stappia albiluteola TaxID=2758565 RepID=A0A839AEM9_9HYPH|nr:hypothetical protein [Stappia albiluteola]MBA5777450.1 hypothetical protein [Stappia albiluteola]MBA5777488.1 hypothetical protein [Stappia albiluteola]MBA5778101.1 hypothetical protein [Stappia albiluteola]MBA5778122.1 hypothetical protein [Stappia albiluteola]
MSAIKIAFRQVLAPFPSSPQRQQDGGQRRFLPRLKGTSMHKLVSAVSFVFAVLILLGSAIPASSAIDCSRPGLQQFCAVHYGMPGTARASTYVKQDWRPRNFNPEDHREPKIAEGWSEPKAETKTAGGWGK